MSLIFLITIRFILIQLDFVVNNLKIRTSVWYQTIEITVLQLFSTRIYSRTAGGRWSTQILIYEINFIIFTIAGHKDIHGETP